MAILWPNRQAGRFSLAAGHLALCAIDRLATVDRRVVRASFERRFTARRMAEDYLHIYETLIQSSVTRDLSMRAYTENPVASCMVTSRLDPAGLGLEARRFRTAPRAS
jgi:hypothetical protein